MYIFIYMHVHTHVQIRADIHASAHAASQCRISTVLDMSRRSGFSHFHGSSRRWMQVHELMRSLELNGRATWEELPVRPPEPQAQDEPHPLQSLGGPDLKIGVEQESRER